VIALLFTEIIMTDWNKVIAIATVVNVVAVLVIAVAGFIIGWVQYNETQRLTAQETARQTAQADETARLTQQETDRQAHEQQMRDDQKNHEKQVRDLQEKKERLQQACEAICVKDVVSLFVPRPNVAGIDYLDQWYAASDVVWPKFQDKWRATNPGDFDPNTPDADFVTCRLEARRIVVQFIEALREASLTFRDLQADADWANIWSDMYDYKTRNIRLIVRGFKHFYKDDMDWSHLNNRAGEDLGYRQIFVRRIIGVQGHWAAIVNTLHEFDPTISIAAWPFVASGATGIGPHDGVRRANAPLLGTFLSN
jgi:hypothetical protein